MKVENFSITPSMFVPGDEVTISFSVRREKADNVVNNGLYVWLSIPGVGEIVAYRDRVVSIAVGETKVVTARTVPEFGTRSFDRGTVLSVFGVQLGLSGQRLDVECPITMLDSWYQPSIKLLHMDRVTDGVLDDEGENVLTDMRISAASSDVALKMALKLYYAADNVTLESEYISFTDKIPELLAGVTDSATLISQTFSKSNEWKFLLVFGDEYESAQLKYTLPRSFSNIHMSGVATGGVCFGGFCTSTENNPKMESHYPAYLYKGIKDVGGNCLSSLAALGIQVGYETIEAAGKSVVTISETFARSYKAKPIVVVGFATESGEYEMGSCSCSAAKTSETGFSINVYNNGSNKRTPTVTWVAIGDVL